MMTFHDAGPKKSGLRPDSAIVVSGVCKAYGSGAAETPVLRGIDLAVEVGQTVFLAGPSGSGKTTLLSILGCILSADEGDVRVLDVNLAELNAKERVRLRRDRLGFVFQRFHLIRGLNVLDNVCVPLTLQRVPRRKARQRGMGLLESVGLGERAKADPRSLSAGQCQRVALARALVSSPEVILADEPTASLDAANGQTAMELLRRLTSDEGKTVVVVTHDSRIFHFADRVFWLENGRISRVENPRSSSGTAREEGVS
jgi:putative ABC transport system ATP-binding protein